MNILIFTGGNPPDFFDFIRFYNRTVEKDDVIIAVDSGADTLYKYLECIKNNTNNADLNSTIQENMLNSLINNTVLMPDYLIGDMDSIEGKEIPSLFPGVKIEKFDSYKDLTDTELSLIKARQINPDANVILIGGNGGRPDHFIGILETFSSEFHPSAWLCGPQVVYYLSDEALLVADNLNENDIISISRVLPGTQEGKVRTTGLEWSDASMRKRGMPSISNRIKKEGTDTTVTVLAEGAPFLVFLPYSAMVKVRQRDK